MAQVYGETFPATDYVRDLATRVIVAVNKQIRRNYERLNAIEYRGQVAQGVNFVVKVQVAGNEYLHLMIFAPLPDSEGGTTLNGVQQNKTLGEALVPF